MRDQLARKRLTLFSRPNCRLCEEMKTTITRVAARVPLDLDEVNITEDRVLESRYGRDIPVLLLDGREIARHRITGTRLEEWIR